MQIIVSPTREETGEQAALRGAQFLRDAVREKGSAAIVLAAGLCQNEMLATLAKQDIEWGKVAAFQLAEILGVPPDHPASMRRYLREHFVEVLKQPLGGVHYIEPETGPSDECRRLDALLRPVEIDVAFLDMGENARLGLNDPPADCETEVAYLIVDLDEATRWQMVDEGWFGELASVPTRAITMSIRRIMLSRAILCTIPEASKAPAVEKALMDLVTPEIPASVLKTHPECHVFLGKDAAAGLRK